jgi:hypothetical protein
LTAANVKAIDNGSSVKFFAGLSRILRVDGASHETIARAQPDKMGGLSGKFPMGL